MNFVYTSAFVARKVSSKGVVQKQFRGPSLWLHWGRGDDGLPPAVDGGLVGRMPVYKLPTEGMVLDEPCIRSAR